MKGGISFANYSIKTTPAEFRDYALASGLINVQFNKSRFLKSFRLRANHLTLVTESFKEHLAQLIADFLRRKLLKERSEIFFRGCFFSSVKNRFYEGGSGCGDIRFATYIFVSTESPDINVFLRSVGRKKKRGHDVPESKIGGIGTTGSMEQNV